MVKNIEIPKELEEFSYLAEDVNILVGENGSGKSILLNEVAKYHSSSGRKVIAITNSIYDKFNVRKRNFKILRNSFGKQLAKRAVVNILNIFSQQNNENKYGVLRVLDYIGLDKCLGIKLKKNTFSDSRPYSVDIEHDFQNSYLYDNDEDRFLQYFNELVSNYRGEIIEDYIIFSLDENNYEWYRAYSFINHFFNNQYSIEEILKRFEFSLMKNGKIMEVLGASSGELTLFTSLVYISSNIDRESIILIDEPENSLHPKWQIEYIKNIVDIFYLYQPKIIIATHSPLLINGGKLNLENINILKGGAKGFFLLERNKKNVEEIYEEYFNLTTPENRYLSDFIMEKFNLLTEDKINLSDFENLVNRFINQSYDDVQKNALKGILTLAYKSVSKN
ncbi:AAA family ATPase [Sphingobacterium hotanense]|uniref:ATP-binding protein n=1 Tax=Sphingobacterium hotanense TaxID=649196 RepID=A0ABT7NSM5_9SPHI|nr:AAA family ATPase [Sphingobacterium hotanense]MDM1050207.1 ATP-binding protein [Sphingobacterium hotanense]